jgi:lysozyme
MNQAGLDLLKHYEGFRENAYLDMVGVPTIGYGFTKGVKLGDRMTAAEAEVRLAEELERFTPDCDGTHNQLAAMTCLAFNIGKSAFDGSTVKRKHLAGDFAGAADAFLLWNKAGGKVVPGLVKRRTSERELYLT